MAEIIKKHSDLAIAVILGLVITGIGIIGMMGMTSMRISSVEAATTADVAVSATVAQSLTLTVTAVNSGQSVNGASTTVTTTNTTVPFGTVTASTNTIAAHDLTVGTNASGGYTLYAKYDQILTSNGDTITNWTGSNATPTTPFQTAGTEAYGYTTNDSTLGTGVTDRFTTSSGDYWAAFETGDKEVAYDAGPVASQTTRVGYQIAIASLTEAGIYVNTTTYTGTGSF